MSPAAIHKMRSRFASWSDSSVGPCSEFAQLAFEGFLSELSADRRDLAQLGDVIVAAPLMACARRLLLCQTQLAVRDDRDAPLGSTRR
jgi:hypothetical protein